MGRRQEHCNVFTASLLHEDTRASDLVLVNACSAAENHGRTFFVIYELTGMPIDKLPLAAADWARTEGFSVGEAVPTRDIRDTARHPKTCTKDVDRHGRIIARP